MEASSNQKQSIGGNLYDGKIAGLYDLEETLGSGHFAVVKLARHVFTGAKVAVKVVDKTKLDEISKAHLFQEVRCMKLVQHPNVVRLYEVIDTQTKLYLVLELGDGGDLYDYIMKHEGGLNENLARKYFKQILRAISYCHQLHVVHRDLKPENVVFFEKLGVVKLTDFGFSNKFSPGQKLETFCGSLAYSAPEILLGDSYDAPAVDIWSLGVILFMLVCGQRPFEKANDSETLTMIMDCKYTVPPQISKSCSELIASMLVRDPKTRATLETIASHPWLRENSETDVLDFLPLVSRHELSEEDQAFILQKMVNGNIATKEDILESLEKNKYNYISATYFLLAEIRLRKRREELMQKKRTEELKSGHTIATNSPVKVNILKQNKVNVPNSLNNSSEHQLIPETTNRERRNRKCSIVKEEDEEESVNETELVTNELQVTLSSRRESISDGRLNKSFQERTEKDKTKATPNSDVSEETIKKFKELDVGRLYPLPGSSRSSVVANRKSKLQKIRTPSCSSSEASDDDSKAKNKKKLNKIVGDTPKRLHIHRRDSYDDSSDSQEHPSPATQSTARRLLGNANFSYKKTEKQSREDHSKNSQTKGGTKNSKQKTNKRICGRLRQLCSQHRAKERSQNGKTSETHNRDKNAVNSEFSHSHEEILSLLAVEEPNPIIFKKHSIISSIFFYETAISFW